MTWRLRLKAKGERGQNPVTIKGDEVRVTNTGDGSGAKAKGKWEKGLNPGDEVTQ